MRIFIGFNIPTDVVNTIVHTQDSLQGSIDTRDIVRWIPKENIHITAIFLGRVEDKNVEDIKLAVEGISRKYEKVEFTIRNFGLWPKGKHPRIVAYNLNHPSTYAQLQAELASKLTPYAPKMAKLKPAHITIGRVNKKVKRSETLNSPALRRTGSRAKLKDIKKLQEAVNKIKFPINNILVSSPELYQSTLTRKGSIYKIL